MRFRRNQGDPFSPMRSLLLRIVALIPVSGCTPAGRLPLRRQSVLTTSRGDHHSTRTFDRPW